ncbi:hypothetical protein E0F98_00040 [Flavobacterium hiemivividum]|uniref:Uncharacterized protein n=1 Tax=Flavobacterium hiemivividum TaxID=2541734 RepID=A0A4R5D6I1_9FLAO|nr:hypothetical protein E0F98_00040 [Flavobacterium hiemivividum]
MVEIFKTNVEGIEESQILLQLLLKHFSMLQINFDLDDCDKILRVEGEIIPIVAIIELLINENYKCEVLE